MIMTCFLSGQENFSIEIPAEGQIDQLLTPHEAVSRSAKKKDRRYEKKCIYDLSICAIFQDEGRFLKEWIEFHKLVGVQHFYLYNNNSTDNYMEILLPYIRNREVTLVHWPSPKDKDWTPYQNSAYQHCLRISKGVTRWLAVIDIDEFLVPLSHDTVVEFLSGYEHVGVVVGKWHVFGTSHVQRISDDRLMIETLTLAAHHPKPGQGRLTKAIVKPHRVNGIGVHNSNSAWGKHRANPWFDGTHGGYPNSDPELRIHHYWQRDIDFFMNVKKERRERYSGKKMTQDQIDRYLTSYNDYEDLEMYRWVDQLRENVFN